MKTLITLLFCLSFATCTLAQEHVFILVDISGSRPGDPIKMDAKQQVYNLILGQYAPIGWESVNITDKKISDLANSISKQALISANSWVCIVPFGAKDTYKKYAISQNKNHPTDFQNFFNSNYPVKFEDRYTYISIAEAFTASLAKTYSINEYYMLIITDGLGDQDDTDSKSTYDTFEDNLLTEWNNSNSIVKNIGSLRKFKYYINLKKVTNITSSSIPINPGITPPIIDSDDGTVFISISSPKKCKKNNEIKLSTDNIIVNWTCPNSPQGIKYSVMVSEYDGGKFREIKRNLTSTTASFKVPDGKFKITVSAQNCSVTSDSTFVEVSTGGFGWIIAIFILAAAVTSGYYIWNRKREEKVGMSASEKASDIFSKNSTGSSSNTSKSDYF
jgi:hypothetical protein